MTRQALTQQTHTINGNIFNLEWPLKIKDPPLLYQMFSCKSDGSEVGVERGQPLKGSL